MSETQITTGSFVNAASTPFFIPVNQDVTRFTLRNLTMSGITALGITGSLTSDRIVEAHWSPTYTTGWALVKQNGTVASSLAPQSTGVVTSQGIYRFNAANQQKGPNIAVASFVPGTTTTFTTGAPHGFIVGDNVRITGMTTAPEIGGLVMTVTAVGSTTTFTTLLNSSASLTSVGTVFKVGNANMPSPSLYYPEWRAIASISLANPMVVTTLVRQNYQIGDVVRFNIPSVYGMQQLNTTNNGLPVEFTVIAVNNAIGTQTVTLAVDSSAYTAFAWPAAVQYPNQLPTMIPQGEGNINNFSQFGIVPAPLPYGNQNILGFATQNQAVNGFLIGAGTGAVGAGEGIIGSTVDAWEWEAFTPQQAFPSGT
jgi:hypothetical protein